uniref:TSC22 domain family protein 1 n=1 Tax=Meloidogyne hapla TaxID=6305 RepID=A0A1I8AZC2_MELHA
MNVAVAKPKERQFQVVPVPAVFTRGRWECIDYKDGASTGGGFVSFSLGGDNQTIEFDKCSASQTPLATQTTVIVGNGEAQHLQSVGVSTTQHHNAQNPVASEQRETTPAPHPQPGIVHQGSTSILPNTAATNQPQQQAHFDISPSQSVPATLGSEFVPPAEGSLVQNSSAASISAAVTTGGPNAVAIDNKIEQAMDLVKTHLTFAVREEVEILRSTIMDLETKVNFLENENQILRQFAPPDFVATLPSLVQQQQQASTNSSGGLTMEGIHSPPTLNNEENID